MANNFDPIAFAARQKAKQLIKTILDAAAALDKL
jgi:hypothetical protein